MNLKEECDIVSFSTNWMIGHFIIGQKQQFCVQPDYIVNTVSTN